jgi:hypothetical protein
MYIPADDYSDDSTPPVALTLGFSDSDNNAKPLNITGELIETEEQIYTPDWQENTWYRFEIRHDGTGTYTGRIWNNNNSRPTEPQARSVGSPPGTESRVAGLSINGGGQQPFDMRHDFMRWGTDTGQNNPPIADAGSNQTVTAAETVTLDASGSSDPDGDTLGYSWTQTAGPDVTLTDSNAATAEFTAPEVESDTELGFNVTVTDGEATDSDSVVVTVSPSGQTLVVDETADSDDPEYPTISAAITDATDVDTIKVRAGTYEESVSVDISADIVATGDVTVVSESGDAAFTIPAESEAAPHIEGISITGGVSGIDANSTTGDWSIEDVEITQASDQGIRATQATGAWEVQESQITLSDGAVGVLADSSTGDWQIGGTVIELTETTLPPTAVTAEESQGDWEIVNSTLTAPSGTAVMGKDTTGDWQIRDRTSLNGTVGLNANQADGNWRVHRTNFDTSTRDIRALATEETTVGNARRNWYGGTEPDIQGEENVLTGNPLGEPASDTATGFQITVVDETNDNTQLQSGATVHLFDLSETTLSDLFGQNSSDPDSPQDAYNSVSEALNDLRGQELVPGFFPTLSAVADRTVETGPDGLVRYTGVAADTNVHLVIVPRISHTGNIHAARQGVSQETVLTQTAELTSDVHFDYLFAEFETRDALVPTIETTAQERISEQVNYLRTIQGKAELDELPDGFEVTDGVTLMGGMKAVFDETTSSIVEERNVNPRTIAADIIEGVGFAFVDEALGAYSGAYITERIAAESRDKQASELQRYKKYREQLQRDWINNPQAEQPEMDGYGQLGTVINTQNAIEEERNKIDTVRTNIEGNINHEHILSAVEHVVQTFTDPGIDPNSSRPTRLSDRPSDYVVTPDGEVHSLLKSQQRLGEFERGIDDLTSNSITDWIGIGIDFVSLVGIVLILIPEPTTTSVGVALNGATVGALSIMYELASSVEDMQAEALVAGSYATIHLDALHDIENNEQMLTGLRKFVEQQAMSPLSGQVDGSLGDINNFVPETLDGDNISSDDEQVVWIKTKEALGVSNDGNEGVPIRIRAYTQNILLERLNEVNASTEVTDRQRAVSFAPPRKSPAHMLETDSFDAVGPITFFVRAQKDNPFGVFVFHLELVMAGKVVEHQVSNAASFASSYFSLSSPTVPQGDIGPDSIDTGSLTPYTSATTPDTRPLTTAELDEFQPATDTVIRAELSAGETATATYTPDGEPTSVTVQLLTSPDASVTLDTEGVEITTVNNPGMESGVEMHRTSPEASVQDEITISAKCLRGEDVSVTVIVSAVPERPAILGTVPGAVTNVGALGDRFRAQLGITEVGNQQSLDGIELDSGQLTNNGGTTLQADALEIDGDVDQVPAGGREDVDVVVTVPEDLELSGEPTRFTGAVTVETETAGSRTIPVSALVVDSTLDTRVTDADNTVTAVRIKETTVTNPGDVPGELKTAYSVTVEGEGSATVVLPEQLFAGRVEAFRYADGTYDPVTFTQGVETSTISVSTGETTVAIVDVPETDVPELPPGLSRAPRDIDNDGVFEDLDADGEITLSDVRLYYRELYQKRDSEYVQDNLEYFDLTDDGEITLADVQALFEERDG